MENNEGSEVVEFNKDEAISQLQNEGYTVRTKEEEGVFAANLQQERESFNREKGSFFESIENDAKKYFGIEKNEGEKAFEMLKRGMKTFSEQRKDVDTSDMIPKTDFERAIAQRDSELNEVIAKNKELQNTLFTNKVSSDLNKSFENRKFAVPRHLEGEEEANSFIDSQKELISSHFLNTYESKEEEGRLIYTLNGEVVRNTKTLEPLTASEIIDQKYKGYFAVPEQPKGTGQKGVSNNALPTFESKKDIAEHLVESEGLKLGSPAFNKRMTELTKGLAL